MTFPPGWAEARFRRIAEMVAEHARETGHQDLRACVDELESPSGWNFTIDHGSRGVDDVHSFRLSPMQADLVANMAGEIRGRSG